MFDGNQWISIKCVRRMCMWYAQLNPSKNRNLRLCLSLHDGWPLIRRFSIEFWFRSQSLSSIILFHSLISVCTVKSLCVRACVRACVHACVCVWQVNERLPKKTESNKRKYIKNQEEDDEENQPIGSKHIVAAYDVNKNDRVNEIPTVSA